MLMTEQVDTRLSPFHLELPGGNLKAALAFYGELLDLAIEPTFDSRESLESRQAMCLLDPSGNDLEFKAFQDSSKLFSK